MPESNRAPLESNQRCPATVMQYDERWGGFRDRCDLYAYHPGPHMSARDACSPTAWLCWVGSYVHPDDHLIGGVSDHDAKPENNATASSALGAEAK